MGHVREFEFKDLFRISKINLDPYTETYNMSFYMHYLINWPELCLVCEDHSGRLMGYILGKTVGEGSSMHGHVTAVTTDPDYRRLGVATQLMERLERVCTREGCYYVDLFVRVSNTEAVEAYKAFGYVVYRRVLGYYSGTTDEDAFDMRKPLALDIENKSIQPTKTVIKPDELSFDDV